jgi:protein-tyrosine phosphatase
MSDCVKPVSVLMVCSGNICRSPAAQVVLSALAAKRGVAHLLSVDSAGLYAGDEGCPADRRMVVHSRARGYCIDHRARLVTGSDFEQSDIIIAMDNANLDLLRDMAATVDESRKIVMVGRFIRHYPEYDYIPDPYYGGAEGFEIVLNLLEDACNAIIDDLLADKLPIF